MKTIILAGITAILLTVIFGFFAVPLLKRIKAGQPILKYVKEHHSKSGTPTMGGLFFILPAVVAFFVFGDGGRLPIVCVAIGLAFMLVGFLDDYLKIHFRKNDGLKAYQKIIFQTLIAIVSGVFCYLNGISVFYLPFSKSSVDFGIFTVPFVALIFIATTNCVNLTDGLDGLAGSVSAVYLLALMLLINIQSAIFPRLSQIEYHGIETLIACIIGGISGFLLFNTSKAKVFMGDTGSLSLGGFIASISIFSANAFFIPIIGIMFVLSGISVIVQVIYYKKTKKRVFLMSPLHHHFQLKGYTEPQITYAYSLITALCGLVSVLSYL